jgi:Protein of unknown function (DUF4236)
MSISAGVRGISYTIGSAGQRATVGLPGTGLYWTHVWRRGITLPSALRSYVIVTGFVVFIALAGGGTMLLSRW